MSEHSSSVSFHHSSPAMICSPLSRDLSLEQSQNATKKDTTPRAKFFKAVADDRHAMHSCTIEDLARLLEDADSAATNEHVLNYAITLANSEVREQLARAEEAAYEAKSSATQAILDADCKLLNLQQEHKAVVEALISAQRESMSVAMQDEHALKQRILQLETHILAKNQKQFDLNSQIEELEAKIEDSTLKLARLESVECRAMSLENALREAWDRVQQVEAMQKNCQSDFDKISVQHFETQMQAQSLESSLNVAKATMIANMEVAFKEKKTFESTIDQLRLDLNLSRDAANRARAQTDAMIGQLSRSQAEKISMTEAHAGSMSIVLAHTLELETLLHTQVAAYSDVQNRLAVSDEAKLIAESQAFAADMALEALRNEYDELRASSQNEVAKLCKDLDALKQEYVDYKEITQAQLSAASKKDVASAAAVLSLQSDLQDSFDLNASFLLRVSQMDAKVKETETKNQLLQCALDQYQFSIADAGNGKEAHLAASMKLEQKHNAPTMISRLGDLSAPSELAHSLDQSASGSSSPAHAIGLESSSSHNSGSNVNCFL